MALNSRSAMMAVGTGMELITGVSESIADLSSLFINPASKLAIEFKMDGIGTDDSVIVVNGPDDFLMSFTEWRMDKYNYDTSKVPLEYIEPKEYAGFFGCTGKFTLIGRASDGEIIKEDLEEFAKEYFLDREDDKEEHEQKPGEEEKLKTGEEEAEDLEDDDVFFTDDEDDVPVKEKKHKKDKSKYYKSSSGTHGYESKASATEQAYSKDKDSETRKERHTEEERKYEESYKQKRREKERAQEERNYRDTEKRKNTEDRFEKTTAKNYEDPVNSSEHRESVRREREERRKANQEYTAGANVRSRDMERSGYGVRVSNLHTETDKANPDVARIHPVKKEFDGVAGRTRAATSEAGNLRYYSAVSVINNSHLQKGIQSGAFLLQEALIPRESAGGQTAHKVLQVAIPVGELVIMSKLKKGAVSLNKGIEFNETLFSSALKNGSPLKADEIPQEMKTMLDAIRANDPDAIITMHDINRYLIDNDRKSFLNLVMGMSKDSYRDFLNDAGLSQDFHQAMLSVKREFFLNKSTFKKLETVATTPEDLKLLEMMKGSLLEGKYGRVSVVQIVKNALKRCTRQLAGNSPGMRGAQSVYAIGMIVSETYKLGMKLITKLAIKNGATKETIKRLVAAQNPIKNAAKHTFKIVKKNITPKLARFFRNAFSAVGKTAGTSAGAAGATAGASAGAAGAAAGASAGAAAGGSAAAAGSGAGGAAAGAAAGGAAVGGVAVGWIVAVVLLVVLIIVSVVQQSELNDAQENYQSPATGGYMYIQDTEILNEVSTLLQQKNIAFMTEINTTATNRSGNAYNPQFSEGVELSFYEEGGYAVLFRDFDGNLLDPKTVDLNNTKAILSLATKYIPYPFTTLSDDASQEEKNEYEQIKQYFIDYCSFLWACTHQVTIEEFHPGDVKFAEYDNTGLVTDEEGQCDQNGTTIWLPDNFVPNEVDGTICDFCSDKPNTGMGDYGDALCTHGMDKNEHDGWRLTGNKATHYNCPGTGHYVCVSKQWVSGGTNEDGSHYSGHWDCDYGYVHCGDTKNSSVGGGIWLCNEKHRHTCYEWVYDCGSHMGSVVYVTIGDLSRIPSLPAAEDVDYSAVGVYQDDD